MGIITAHAPPFIVITSILIAAIRDLCICIVSILGFPIVSEDASQQSCTLSPVAGFDDAHIWESFRCRYIVQEVLISEIGSNNNTGDGQLRDASTSAKVVIVEMVPEGEGGVCKQLILAPASSSSPPLPLPRLRWHSHSFSLVPTPILLLSPPSPSSEWQPHLPLVQPHQQLSSSTSTTITISECAICLCEFEKGQILRIMPNCGHAFHSDCILKWLEADFLQSSHPDNLQASSAIYDNATHSQLHMYRNKTCPICRTSILFNP